MIFLQSFLLWLLVLKYTRLHVLKNKKIRKNLYIKIEKRQRGIRRAKGGGGIAKPICTQTACNIGTTRSYRIYIARPFAYDTLSKDRNGVFVVFRGAMLAFVCVCGLCAAVARYALKKRLFEERGTLYDGTWPFLLLLQNIR